MIYSLDVVACCVHSSDCGCEDGKEPFDLAKVWENPVTGKLLHLGNFKLCKNFSFEAGDACLQLPEATTGPAVSGVHSLGDSSLSISSKTTVGICACFFLVAAGQVRNLIKQSQKNPSGLKFNNFFIFLGGRGTLSNSCVLLWSPGRCDTLLGWVNLASGSFLITWCVVAKGVFPWCRLSSRFYFEVLAWFDWNWTVGQ